jgi:hypothetical protein
MPRYRLPGHVHFCEIDGRRLFLDLAADRYFTLPAGTDAVFGALLGADRVGEPPAEELAFLIRSGILVAAPEGRPIAATRYIHPNLSLVEQAGTSAQASLPALVQAWWLVRRARAAVGGGQLPTLLASLSAGRQASARPSAERRARAIAAFRAARRLVPIAPNCLYDSIALRRFLQRRGIAADLVIGAKLHPFGAHCWLQQGALVLNDTLSAARDFTPVLVA